MPGSCTSRVSIDASSLRIWSATLSGRDPWDMWNHDCNRAHRSGAPVTAGRSTRRGHGSRLRRGGDPFLDEDLDEVPDLDVVEALEADAALETGFHLAHVVLEAAQRSDLAFVDD